MSYDNQTGSIGDNNTYTINYPFEKYILKIRLSSENKFIGIEEILINKEFITYVQQNRSKGYHDIEQFYSE